MPRMHTLLAQAHRLLEAGLPALLGLQRPPLGLVSGRSAS